MPYYKIVNRVHGEVNHFTSLCDLLPNIIEEVLYLFEKDLTIQIVQLYDDQNILMFEYKIESNIDRVYFEHYLKTEISLIEEYINNNKITLNK